MSEIISILCPCGEHHRHPLSYYLESWFRRRPLVEPVCGKRLDVVVDYADQTIELVERDERETE